ncbi:M20/M25/M40 family metallo-hydrolase [uncultured Tenacibaculum sp.]|uniref:M20/M25/M40 family metallo-hydrolase n=1 Tax=uncultured Tenacibaculum sp. TaxID=174713 RepID=UPI00262F4AD3|nr:M20/M25/M40 family metallo-hydrolase [uncultured Tenacibaculum sp.]
MKDKIKALGFIFLVFISCVKAQQKEKTQERINQKVIEEIKKEAFDNSQVMQTLIYIADVYGPRITGSEKYYNAATWAKQRMEKWGLDDPRFDTYDNTLRGWNYEFYNVEMVAPTFMAINALPYQWVKSTNGEVTGEIIVVNHKNLNELKKYKGQLKGKILMSPHIPEVEDVNIENFSDKRLEAASSSKLADDPEGLDNGGLPPFKKFLEYINRSPDESYNKLQQFLLDEEVAAVITSSSKGLGIVSVESTPYKNIGDLKPVPHFSIAKDQYLRMMNINSTRVQLKLKLQLNARFYDNPEYHVNVLADIKGTDPKLKDEIVLVGAHFDSKVGGTGAADNGAGSATIMEAMRILKAIGVKPRRTIRIALWDGEEEGLNGSLGYIKKYVGDINTGATKTEQSKISVYFNMDQNGHDVRGIFTQGNTKVRPIFDAYLKSFHEYGAKTTTIQNACCTDHLGFDALGIPAFEWIYDPSYYFSHQLHVSTDMIDLVKEDSMKRNAAIVAGFIYHAAMRDEMMPRK